MTNYIVGSILIGMIVALLWALCEIPPSNS
jgi:hypothetical protein